MKIKYLRWLDKNIAGALCIILFICGRLSKIVNFYTKQYFHIKSSKILVIKFLGFGSITLAFDFFKVIRKNYPQAYICVLTLKQNRTIFEMFGFFDEIIDIDLKSLPRFALDMIKLIIGLRRMSFDVAFDLEFGARSSALITRLSNAKKRIGFQYAGVWRGDCFTETIKFKEDMKLRKSYLALAGLIVNNINILPETIRLRMEDKQQDYINNLFVREGLNNGYPIVGINVNASELSFLRRWPREHFIILIKELIEKYSAQIIFVGAKEDISYVNETIERIPFKKNIHNFAGKTSLPQLACLLRKLKLFISNDSGPLHLASCIGIPTISFFGPETPLIYGPEGPSDIVFYKKLDCSPCLHIKKYKHSNCLDRRCLKEIKPSEVIDEIKRKGLL